VHGVATGSPHLQKTVIPVEAVANVSLRLAPGQEVEEVATAFEGLIREAVPPGAELTIERWAASGPGLVPPGSQAIGLAQDAFERVVGRRPLLIRGGGTLPIVPAFTGKGIPAIITGFGLPDAQIHSPNERLRADYVPLGIAAARETFRELANLHA
jgi:acetylornithine deacetylase/succinyl-diaminopimelate desuccinylase-like protein